MNNTIEIDERGGFRVSSGVKYDSNKPRVSLVLDGFPRALMAVAEVATFGAEKYTPHGWQTVPNALGRYRDAMDRHRLATDERDVESGLLHAAHHAWNALAALELALRAAEEPEG